MARKLISILLVLLQLTLWAPPARTEYESIYHYYIEEGIEAFYKNDFKDAFFYFTTAHAIDPSRPQPRQYLNIIKRSQEGRLKSIVPDSQGNDLFKASLAGPIPTEKLQAQLVDAIAWQAARKILQEFAAEQVTETVIKDTSTEVAQEVRSEMGAKIPDEIFEKVVAQVPDAVIHRLEEFLKTEKETTTTITVPSETMPVSAMSSVNSSFGKKLSAPVSVPQKSGMTEKVSVPETEATKPSAQSMAMGIPSTMKEPFPVKKGEAKSAFPPMEKVEISQREIKSAQEIKLAPEEKATPIVFKSGMKEELPAAEKLVVPLGKKPLEVVEPTVASVPPAPHAVLKEEKEEAKAVISEKAPIAPPPLSIIEEEKEVRLVTTPKKPAPMKTKKKKEKPVKLAPFKPKGPLAPQTERKDDGEAARTISTSHGNIRHLANGEEVRMDDELWKNQAAFILEIEIGKSVIFVGKNIARFLVTNEGLLEVTRVDKDRLRVKAVRRGNTILYIWDDKGRWTFNVRCEYGFGTDGRKDRDEEQAKPFRMDYSNSWSTYHKGPELDSMNRQSVAFTNWLGISGETPYGFFDASANTFMFAASTEVIGQRVGLTDGHIGPFKDFRLRGYDIYKSLSPLTLAGRYFRGVLIDAYAFEHKWLYSYFRGQDKSVTIFTSEQGVQDRESYVEGFKIILNPDELTGQYAFNYARGFGPARHVGLNSEAYSLETKQQMGEWELRGELGYDQDVFATLLSSMLQRKDLNMTFNLRDIDKDYQTVYGRPSSAGTVGGQWYMNWMPPDFTLSSYLDVYRDRALPNPEHPNLLNVDFSTAFSKTIDDTSSWGASAAYANTPQTISPRESVQLSSNYSKNYKLGTRYFSVFVGDTAQWSRNELSPTSDYDRFSLRAGFRIQVIKNLLYSMSYDYIWVRDVSTDTWSNPKAIQTGLNYNVSLTDALYLSVDLNYRKEYETQSTFSFLAGEDSLSNTLGLTYRPMQDMQIYMDSQLRRVWPHDTAMTPPYYDWNLMVGMRASWDLPFRWNPAGKIHGIVYKDYNGNSVQDKDEPGMGGVKVMAGKFQTKTNDNGEYELTIHAKKTTISLDLKTVPPGFIFSTALSRDVVIENNGAVAVNFGLTSRSGIYGIAYVDVNESGKPDLGDKFLQNIAVRLDGAEITKTNPSGSYFFEDIIPGKHKIRIEVNSIPLKYSPTVKIETELELEEGMTYVYNIPLKENPASR